MGERDDAPHTELFWRSGQNHAARVGNYKLVRFGSEFDQLFDLAADIGEWYDLAATRGTLGQRGDGPSVEIRQDRQNAEVGRTAEDGQQAGFRGLS